MNGFLLHYKVLKWNSNQQSKRVSLHICDAYQTFWTCLQHDLLCTGMMCSGCCWVEEVTAPTSRSRAQQKTPEQVEETTSLLPFPSEMTMMKMMSFSPPRAAWSHWRWIKSLAANRISATLQRELHYLQSVASSKAQKNPIIFRIWSVHYNI